MKTKKERLLSQEFITSPSRLGLSSDFPTKLIRNVETLDNRSKALNARFYDYPQEGKKCYVLHLNPPTDDVEKLLEFVWFDIAPCSWTGSLQNPSIALVCLPDGSLWSIDTAMRYYFVKGNLGWEEFKAHSCLGYYHEMLSLPEDLTNVPEGIIMINFMTGKEAKNEN